MDATRNDNKPQNLDATIRVGTPQPTDVAGGQDITVRPGARPAEEKSDNSADFVLKGRVYRGIKCLSDNSGEAQVFLVEGDEGEMVLKVYYPNFTIKKTLMRIIQNFNLSTVRTATTN